MTKHKIMWCKLNDMLICRPLYRYVLIVVCALCSHLYCVSQLVAIGDLKYYVYNGEAELFGPVDGVTEIENPVIPDEISLDGRKYPVTEIRNMAFRNSTLRGSLTLSQNLRKIGQEAFYGNPDLSGNLILPKSIKSIGRNAFFNCSGFMGDLIIPETIELLDESAFNSCSGLNGNLHIPDFITELKSSVFAGCGFTGELKLPSGLKILGGGAFHGCSFSGDLNLPESLTYIGDGAFSDCSGFSGRLIIPESVTYIGNRAFAGCTGFTGDLRLPDNLTAIGDTSRPNSFDNSGAFYNCTGFDGLLYLPESLTIIGGGAFNGCNGLQGSLKLPSGLKEIGMYAFQNCTGFNGDLKIPDGVSVISACAFRGCRGFNGKLSLPKTLTSIDHYAFYECGRLTGTLEIPSGVTSIRTHAFYNCSNLVADGENLLPDGLLTIESSAFGFCKGLKGSLVIPDKVTSVGEFAFVGCKGLTGDLYIGESIKTIEERAFSGLGFKGDLMIKSCETIGHYAFESCKFKSMELPANLKEVDYDAFDSNFENGIKCKAVVPPLLGREPSSTAFDKSAYDKPLYVPAESISLYQSAYEWRNFTNIRTLDGEEPIKITLNINNAELKVGESVELVANITPETTVDKSVSWMSANESVATVDSNGRVTAIAVGEAVVTATATSGASAQCSIVVRPRPETSVTISPVNMHGSGKMREGGRLELMADTPSGGNDEGWTFKWYADGSFVSSGQDFSRVMTMDSGREKAIHEVALTVSATNVGPDGSVWGEANSAPFTVAVYRRPLTPVNLLRKGDGSTHTLIAMSQYGDDDLERLGYTFVYGYTDALGEDHIVATTAKRYCRIDARIFDDVNCDKWCYAQWQYGDGSVVTSGKRYLDGNVDEEFDASDFTSGGALQTTRDFSDSGNWIQTRGDGVSITIETISDTKIDIFNVSGMLVESRMLPADTYVSLDYGADSLAPGFYIVTISSAENQVSKKILIK